MAKKKTERKPSNIREAIGLARFLKSERADFLFGLLIIAFAVYTLIAMFSYMKTGAADQSILENLRPGEWINTDRKFVNYGSSFGALLSYFFITNCFGYAAFLIPCFLIVVGIKMMQVYQVNLWKWFFGTCVTMLWLSVFMSKVLTPLLPDLFFNPGGNHGVVSVTYTENLIGPPGLTALLFFTAVAILTFISKQTITWIRRMFNPLKTAASKASEMVNDKLTKLNEGEDDTEKTVSAEDNAEESNKKNRKSNNAANQTNDATPRNEETSSVIDLTNFSAMSANTSANSTHTAKPAPAQTRTASQTVSNPTDRLTVEVGKEEKASGQNVASTTFDTPINPLEPFTRYKRPGLDLLKRDDNEGKPYVDMEEIKTHNEEIVRVKGNSRSYHHAVRDYACGGYTNNQDTQP